MLRVLVEVFQSFLRVTNRRSSAQGNLPIFADHKQTPDRATRRLIPIEIQWRHYRGESVDAWWG